MISPEDVADFDKAVRESFSFLPNPSPRGAHRAGGDDPRDAELVFRFTPPDLRVVVGWSSFELALAITLKFERPGLTRRQSYVYFEPFIEFLTGGVEKAIAPYVSYAMGLDDLAQLGERRQQVFASGLAPVLRSLGDKFRRQLPRVSSASNDEIRAYHAWAATPV